MGMAPIQLNLNPADFARIFHHMLEWFGELDLKLNAATT